MLENMGRLDNNFWNATSGNWSRYYSGIDMLRERLAAINAASAADPAAAADGEVKTIVAGVNKAKADCLAISKEYWTTAMRVQAVGCSAGCSRQCGVDLRTDRMNMRNENRATF